MNDFPRGSGTTERRSDLGDRRRRATSGVRAWSARSLAAAALLLLTIGCASDAAAQPSEQDTYGHVEGIGTTEKRFRFAVWGDAQVAHYQSGDPLYGKSEYREKSTAGRDRLERIVELTNRLAPEFTVTVGDNVHGAGEIEHYKLYNRVAKSLTKPLYMIMGNHEWAERSVRFPDNPYGTREFGNFLWAQKDLNGLEKAWFSFDSGDWHFVMWSQAGLGDNGINHYHDAYPQFLRWLREDLAANKDRPTFFFTHHPLLPVGRKLFEHYNLDAENRNELIDIVLTHGNVKYAMFGHVHQTVASSPLISWNYRGTAFFMVPNTANSIRDRDYLETYQSSWGVVTVDVDGADVTSIAIHTLAGEEVRVTPMDFPEYDEKRYGFTTAAIDLADDETLENGGFEQDLYGTWLVNHLLPYEQGPVHKRELTVGDAAEGERYLRLETRANPGRTTTHGPIVAEVRQVLRTDPNRWPLIALRYRILNREGPANTHAYVAVTGWQRAKRKKLASVYYSIGDSQVSRLLSDPPNLFHHFTVDPVLGEWTEIELSPRSDFDIATKGPKWDARGIDVVEIMIGNANDNGTPEQKPVQLAVGFDDVRFRDGEADPGPSKTFRAASPTDDPRMKDSD